MVVAGCPKSAENTMDITNHIQAQGVLLVLSKCLTIHFLNFWSKDLWSALTFAVRNSLTAVSCFNRASASSISAFTTAKRLCNVTMRSLTLPRWSTGIINPAPFRRSVSTPPIQSSLLDSLLPCAKDEPSSGMSKRTPWEISLPGKELISLAILSCDAFLPW